MKKILTTAIIGVAMLTLAGCKGGDKKAEKAHDAPAATVETTTPGYTKADYMKACQQAMTEAQCNCFVDFYKGIGLEVTELGDQAKVQAAVAKMTPEQAMEQAKCTQ